VKKNIVNRLIYENNELIRFVIFLLVALLAVLLDSFLKKYVSMLFLIIGCPIYYYKSLKASIRLSEYLKKSHSEYYYSNKSNRKLFNLWMISVPIINFIKSIKKLNDGVALKLAQEIKMNLNLALTSFISALFFGILSILL